MSRSTFWHIGALRNRGLNLAKEVGFITNCCPNNFLALNALGFVFFFFLNLINDGLDTYKLYGFQQQQEVVSPIPDLLKGGKGSWAGNTAHGLSDHRLAGSVWQVAVTNTGCFLSHKQNAFCRAQHILEVFIMEVLWMQW